MLMLMCYMPTALHITLATLRCESATEIATAAHALRSFRLAAAHILPHAQTPHTHTLFFHDSQMFWFLVLASFPFPRSISSLHSLAPFSHSACFSACIAPHNQKQNQMQGQTVAHLCTSSQIHFGGPRHVC